MTKDWTFVIPLKPAAGRKQRLAGALPLPDRIRLTEEWLANVVVAARMVGNVVILSDQAMSGTMAGWRRDCGRGLNAELDAAYVALRSSAVAIVLADLPLVTADDLRALTMAAETAGCAIAPDRHGTGTNAIALADGRPFRFAFGPGSFTLHCAATRHRAAVVRRAGLGLDIDTPADWAEARAAHDWHGLPPPAFLKTANGLPR